MRQINPHPTARIGLFPVPGTPCTLEKAKNSLKRSFTQSNLARESGPLNSIQSSESLARRGGNIKYKEYFTGWATICKEVIHFYPNI